MRLAALLTGLAMLASCGADGEPVTPVASANISVGSSGLNVLSRVGVNSGPLTVTLAL